MRKWCSSLTVVRLAWLAWILSLKVSAQQNSVLCRIDDLSKVRECTILRDCLYRSYPVEVAQGNPDPGNCGGLNSIFSLFGGGSACNYFTNLISTEAGRIGLANSVQQQLQNSQFRGLDLQCDPTNNGGNQTAYNGVLRLLRRQLGRGYIMAVRIENPNLDPVLIDTLNEVVDLITSPQDDSTVQGLIRRGCRSRKIVITIQFPPVVTCPTDERPLRSAADSCKSKNLFGATVQLDRDDVDNTCGEGTFPQFKKLVKLLGGDDAAQCNFTGFIPDPKDRSQFFSCNNGVRDLHQCPEGQLFDPGNSTCIPFIRMNCNGTSCSIVGPVTVTNETTFIPIAIPIPVGIPTTTLPPPTPPPTAPPVVPPTAPPTPGPDQMQEILDLLKNITSQTTLPPVTNPPVTTPPVTNPSVTIPSVTVPPLLPITLPPLTLPPLPFTLPPLPFTLPPLPFTLPPLPFTLPPLPFTLPPLPFTLPPILPITLPPILPVTLPPILPVTLPPLLPTAPPEIPTGPLITLPPSIPTVTLPNLELTTPPVIPTGPLITLPPSVPTVTLPSLETTLPGDTGSTVTGPLITLPPSVATVTLPPLFPTVPVETPIPYPGGYMPIGK